MNNLKILEIEMKYNKIRWLPNLSNNSIESLNLNFEENLINNIK
jgi:hypothetical protein